VKRLLGRITAGLACAAALCAAQPASATPPLCRTSLSLTPEHPWVGEQVVYRLRIARRRDVPRVTWERAPSFPAFRAEWLAPLAAAEAPAADETWRLTEERRALFPARAGVLQIPEAALRCESPTGGEIVVVPAAQLTVRAIPRAGRPAGWRGLVGPLQAQLRAVPEALPLGSSARLSLLLSGPVNVWDAHPRLKELLVGSAAELFPRPAELSRNAGQKLVLEQYRSYDIVPHRLGRLEIPPLHIPWWNPRAQAWSETTTPALVLRVTAAAAQREDMTTGRTRGPGRARAQTAAPRKRLERLGLLLVVAAGLGTGLLLLWRLRKRRGAQAPDPVALALQEAALAERAGDLDATAGALARGLRAALEPTLPGAATLTAEECYARAEEPARELALLLQKLERVRFMPGGSAAELRDVRRRLEARIGSPTAAPRDR